MKDDCLDIGGKSNKGDENLRCQVVQPIGITSVLLILAAISCGFAEQSKADPTDYFPSVPIHEDDGIGGETHLLLDGCELKITQFDPSRASPKTLTITSVNLVDFETNPANVNLPYAASPLSTRHMIAWFAKQLNDKRVDDANEVLHTARLSFKDRRNMSDPKVVLKRKQIKSLLDRIESGEFGVFAKANVTKRYLVGEDGPELTSASIAQSFQMPVQRNQAQVIVVELDAHRSKFCDGIGSRK